MASNNVSYPNSIHQILKRDLAAHLESKENAENRAASAAAQKAEAELREARIAAEEERKNKAAAELLLKIKEREASREKHGF